MQITKYKNLDEIGIDLINKIKKDNIDPFKEKKIVFANSKLEQWFKAYWLKNEDSVLMNVSFEKIGSFLINLFGLKRENIIDHDILMIEIMKVIANESFSLDDNLKKYVYDDIEKKILNESRFYDFASKMASLFCEYENLLYDFENKSDTWQIKLYNKIIDNLICSGYSSIYYEFKKGNININNDDNILFVFNDITPLQNAILEKIDGSIIYQFDEEYLREFKEGKVNNLEEKEVSVIAAPSKLREIEAVHSDICNILRSDKTVTFSDFLIVSPKITEYENVIARVFTQTDDRFLSLPFVISDTKNVSSPVSLGIKTLVEILDKGFFSRKDFNNIITNKTIQIVKGINEEEANVMKDLLLKMNVYRDSKKNDDWDYAKKRLLLSKLIDIGEKITINVNDKDKEYTSYQSIDANDNIVTKFINIVNEIKEWESDLLEYNDKCVDDNFLIIIKEKLDNWFSFSNDDEDIEFNYYYKDVVNLIKKWESLEVCKNNIPVKAFYYSLIDASLFSSLTKGMVYSDGISCVSLSKSYALSAKYVYVIGMGSKMYPREDIKSELDIRDNYEFKISSKTEEDKNAFYKQYFASNKSFKIFYVNKDLKKDEDFYLSTVVIDLLKLINKEKCIDKDHLIQFSLDENRKWSELYTKREFKAKDYYLGLTSQSQGDFEKSEISTEFDKPNKIKLRDLVGLLKEPMTQKLKNLFGKTDDDSEDIIEEFEPLDDDALNKSNIYKEYVIRYLKYKCENKDFDEDEMKNQIKNEIKAEFNLKNLQYDTKYRECVFEDGIKNGEKIIGNIGNAKIFPKKEYQFETDGTKWSLVFDLNVCSNDDDSCYKYTEIRPNKTDIDSKVVEYLTFLIDIVDKCKDDCENTCIISILDKEGKPDKVLPITVTAKEAKEYIDMIYNEYNNYDSVMPFPIKLFEEDPDKVTNAYTLYEKIKDASSFDKELLKLVKREDIKYDDWKNEFSIIFNKRSEKSRFEYLRKFVELFIKEKKDAKK